QQKKAAMQKIFSQEVRFKQDDGAEFPEWEEKTLSDICETILGGGTPTTENKNYWNGNIAWVSSSDLKNNNIHQLSITRFITEEAINVSATKLIPRNSVLIVSRVGVGKVVVAPCELCTSQDFTNIVNPKCNSMFLGYLLSVTMQHKANGVQGTSIKGITAKEIKQYKLYIPHNEEQQKIADFLSAYDEAITYAKQELDKWKELKKGFMQKMFI
ncbi:MAG: restriction endonuclease subunit S, partial [Ruminococcus sp.]|nr:restriction endonuclease subunit S [Ruminococcus sp.]